MTLWIIGESKKGARVKKDGSTASEFKGIFDTKKAATKACLSPKHWLAPVELNAIVVNRSGVMVDAHYPLAKS